MDFALELGYTKLLQESEVGKHVIDMRNENLQIQNEFTVFKDIVETELFIHSAGIALVTGTKFKTSIPYSINEKRRISSSDPCEFVYGETKTVYRTILKVFSCPSVVGMKVTCRVNSHVVELLVPYDMNLHHESKTCKCISRGNYRKMFISSMHLSVSIVNND